MTIPLTALCMIPNNDNKDGPPVCPPVVWLVVNYHSYRPLNSDDYHDAIAVTDAYLAALKQKFKPS